MVYQLKVAYVFDLCRAFPMTKRLMTAVACLVAAGVVQTILCAPEFREEITKLTHSGTLPRFRAGDRLITAKPARLEAAHDPLGRDGGHDLIGVVDQPAGLG